MKISIWLIIALIGFPQISETIYTPALPSIVNGLQASAYMVEATLAIYFLGISLGVLLWGAVSDNFGRKPVMLTGILIYGISTFACANIHSIEGLIAWRFFQAFGASVGSVITQTILRDSYDATQRVKVFSVISGALAFSPAIGPLIGGIISEYFSWRANFWTLAIFSLILLFWTQFSLKETRPENLKRLKINDLYNLSLSMVSSSNLWGHVLLIAGTNGILFGFYQEAPFIFIEQLGMTPKLYGCFGLLIAGATILAAQVSYVSSHKFSPGTLIKCGSLLVFCGAALFTITVMTGIILLNTGLLFMIFALFIVFFGIGLIIPNSLSHALKPYQHNAGGAGSIFGGLYYLLIALCMWSMSAIHNGTALPLPIYMTALSLVIAFGAHLTTLVPLKNKIV